MVSYSHANHDGGPPSPCQPHMPAPGEGRVAPVSAGVERSAATAADRRTGSGGSPRNRAGVPGDGSRPRIRVVVVGATGYVGAGPARAPSPHPNGEGGGLVARGRDGEPVGATHPHLSTTGLLVDADRPAADAVFLALPHGTAATIVPELAAAGTTVIDLGPDFRLRDAADYPRWYKFDHPRPELLVSAVYGLPELHRAELAALVDAPTAIVGSPGCYPTATLLALAPLARAGLIGDLVVDAKSGVSGAGRDPKPDMMFGEINESVKAYGLGGHRHVAEIEQELRALSGGAFPGGEGVDFLPHLIPMTRGILSTCHVRPSRRVTQEELDGLYAAAYDDEPFVTVVDAAPATKHVTGSNHARVHVHLDARSGRIIAIGVIDNLVKGAAGQAIQAFNIVHGLDEMAGLKQLPLAP